MSFIVFTGTLLRVTEALLVTTLGQHPSSSKLVPGKLGYSISVLLSWSLVARSPGLGSGFYWKLLRCPAYPSVKIRELDSPYCFLGCWCFESFYHLHEWKKRCLGWHILPPTGWSNQCIYSGIWGKKGTWTCENNVVQRTWEVMRIFPFLKEQGSTLMNCLLLVASYWPWYWILIIQGVYSRL